MPRPCASPESEDIHGNRRNAIYIFIHCRMPHAACQFYYAHPFSNAGGCLNRCILLLQLIKEEAKK